MKRIRLVMTVLPTVVAIGVVLGATAPAHAAPAQSTALRVSFPAGVCELRVQDPHDSSHVDGTVNVIATVICTSAVSSIAGAISLRLNGSVVASKGSGNTGSASLRMQVAAPCVPGTYTALAATSIVFPPGSVPPTGNIEGTSKSLTTIC